MVQIGENERGAEADAQCGYGENSRVLEWVFDRSAGRGEAIDTAIGYVPTQGAIDIEGLSVSADDMAELLAVNHDDWRAEVPLIREHLAQFKSRTPERLNQLVNELESALK